MASKIISSWISPGPDDKNVVRRIRSQQQQQQPQQHKTLTKVNSGPGSPCETYMGSDKQLYCDKNLQQIQNISRQSFNPYVCHSCLRGGQPVRPVSLVTPDEAEHVHLVPRPSVKRSVSHHQQRRHMRAAPVVRSGTVVTSGRPPSTKASASDWSQLRWLSMMGRYKISWWGALFEFSRFNVHLMTSQSMRVNNFNRQTVNEALWYNFQSLGVNLRFQ